MGGREEGKEQVMSEKSKKGIIQAISTLLKGGMECDKIEQYIHNTYMLKAEQVGQLISLAQISVHAA